MKILLATDGSECSEGAAKFLTFLNLSSQDAIIIFHAISWIPCLYGRESYYENLKAIKEEIAPKVLSTVQDILKPLNAKIDTLIIDGSPEHCIMDASCEFEADLIIMGARGTKETDPLFIGDVTRAVAIKSSQPILVAKLPVCRTSGRIKILFATDGSESSTATAKILSEIPFTDRTEITVLNVTPWEFLDIPKKYVPQLNEKLNEIIEETKSKRLIESKEIIDHAKEYLNKKFMNISGLSKVGDPSTEIIKASEKLEMDLIAVGCRGLKGIKGMMGSVSRNVLANSKCSVLIGKACGA
jgi:nucleotide-binding universal stress UspA family protein